MNIYSFLNTIEQKLKKKKKEKKRDEMEKSSKVSFGEGLIELV